MAASVVLGKRTRCSSTSGTTLSDCLPCFGDTNSRQGYSLRSKRVAQEIEFLNDENVAPITDCHDTIVVASPSEKLAAVSIATPKTRRVRRPAKHGTPNSRVPVSPNTIDSHFSVTKAVDRSGKKDSTISTPQTPRHRDALSKQDPITPRHRVQITGTPRTPRNLSTPSTPSTPSSGPYTQARPLFSSCCESTALIGRQTEKDELSRFISNALQSSNGGCLYISGPPGTGKSALTGEITKQLIDCENQSLSVINCMSVKSASDLAQKLTQDLDLKPSGRKAADFEHLKSCFFENSTQKSFVVLDEVDRIVDLDLKFLYNLFEWSTQSNSQLVLIGIANALDLTDRLLPRLKSRNIRPDLLPFMPYTAPQIVEIISSKLRSLNEPSAPADYVPFLHPAAIQLCSKKVAASTGDLRKAFDICRRAIDVAEQEARAEQSRLVLQESPSKTPLAENINLASPPVQQVSQKPRQLKLLGTLSHLTTTTAPRATIAHVARITALVFSNGTSQRLTTLNLQQKAVLCSLVGAEQKRRSLVTTFPSTPSKTAALNAAPTTKQLYETYSSLVKRENLLHPLTSVEFRDVLSGLETLSLVSAVEGKNGSFAIPITPSRTPGRKGKAAFTGAGAGDEKRFSSSVGFAEVLKSLTGPGSEILKDILEGGA